jgi:Phosphatidylglycerol lysyltransferase, C-terminal
MSQMQSLALLAAIKHGLDACDAQASFFSPLNAISRLAMGKWTIEELAGTLGFVSGDVVRIVPPVDKGAYYQAILEWATTKRVTFVPGYMADVFRQRGFKVAKVQTEYVMDPEKLRTLPGGALRNRRYDVSRAGKVATAQLINPADHLVELLALNDCWYGEAKSRIWRPSEKTHIEWLLTHWDEVLGLEPTARCVGVFDNADGKMLSFELGSMLSDSMASSFTQRSDRSKLHGLYAGVNLFCSTALAVDLGVHLNDGPAGDRSLAERKGKLCIGALDLYSVARK